MTREEIIILIKQQIDASNSASRYQLSPVQNHSHNGVDSPRVSQADVVPSTRASGDVVFATDATTYTLGLTFNPSNVMFYGIAIRTNSVFIVTAANATAGAVYSNNGYNFTVLVTIAGATTLVTAGTGTAADASGSPITNAAASGTLTKVSGTGDATITFSSVSATIGIRAHVVGSAQLGNTYYFQPASANSTVIGGPQQTTIQSSSYLSIDATNTTTSADGQKIPVTHALTGEGHLVDVFYSSVRARATITGYTSSAIKILTSFDSGWYITGNYVVT